MTNIKFLKLTKASDIIFYSFWCCFFVLFLHNQKAYAQCGNAPVSPIDATQLAAGFTLSSGPTITANFGSTLNSTSFNSGGCAGGVWTGFSAPQVTYAQPVVLNFSEPISSISIAISNLQETATGTVSSVDGAVTFTIASRPEYLPCITAIAPPNFSNDNTDGAGPDFNVFEFSLVSGGCFTSLTFSMVSGTDGYIIIPEDCSLASGCSPPCTTPNAGTFQSVSGCIPHDASVTITHNGDEEISNIQEYAITNEHGFILDIQPNPDFGTMPTGDYSVYAINYSPEGLDNLILGTNINTLTGSCFTLSSINISVCSKRPCKRYTSLSRQ